MLWLIVGGFGGVIMMMTMIEMDLELMELLAIVYAIGISVK